jgi:hypothetical protein
MSNIIKIKRKIRPLTRKYFPTAPYVIEREDMEDGTIRYCIWDYRPETYRFVCATNDDGGTDPNAKKDAEKIVRALNLLVQYGIERG